MVRTSSHKKQKTVVFGLSFLFIAIAVSLFITLSGIFAQNQLSSQSLEVSPPSQEITGNPGDSVTITSKIRNKSGETLPIKAHIEDFTASGDEGQVALETKGPYSLTSWSTITPQTFSLKPGQEQTVVASVKIPVNKVAGGYYGSFVYSVVSEQKGGVASLGQEIASLFLLKVNGQVNEKLLFEEFKSPPFSEFGPIPFTMKFVNTGNIHTKAFGLINVSDMFGQKVTDIVVNGTNVFPGASRILRSSLDKRFLFGRYTATAIIYFGSIKNETLTGVTSFVVFPVRIVAGIFVLIALLYALRKRLKKALKVLFG